LRCAGNLGLSPGPVPPGTAAPAQPPYEPARGVAGDGGEAGCTLLPILPNPPLMSLPHPVAHTPTEGEEGEECCCGASVPSFGTGHPLLAGLARPRVAEALVGGVAGASAPVPSIAGAGIGPDGGVDGACSRLGLRIFTEVVTVPAPYRRRACAADNVGAGCEGGPTVVLKGMHRNRSALCTARLPSSMESIAFPLLGAGLAPIMPAPCA